MKLYNAALVPRARSMRRDMTAAEKPLWFNVLKLLPHKFRKKDLSADLLWIFIVLN